MTELNCLEIVSSEEHADLLGAALVLHVKHGWEEEDIPQGVLVRVYSPSIEFCLELEKALKNIEPSWQITQTTVPAQDWVSAWKEFFIPVQAGRRFLVLAPWMEEERAGTSRQPVIIEPKTAFGTGHHATTALCLTALSDLFDAGRITAGQRFLDLGTGSGILGIGAALLGLKGVGVDPDIMAVENAVENRSINGVAESSFVVRRGSLEVVSEDRFDLVMANILAEPLINMAGHIAGKIKKGGCIILSGILETQAGMVEERYSSFGLPKARVTVQDEWVSIVWDEV